MDMVGELFIAYTERVMEMAINSGHRSTSIEHFLDRARLGLESDSANPPINAIGSRFMCIQNILRVKSITI